MQDVAHVLELLPAYALGCLDEGDAKLVAAHLAGCELCMKELDSLQSVVGQLALSAPDSQPSAKLKPHIMDRAHKLPLTVPERENTVRQPLLLRLFPALGIVAVILILALSATSVLLWQRTNQSVNLTGPNGMRAIALQSTNAAPRSSAMVIISSDGENGVLVVDDLKQLDPAQQYQVWLIKDGKVTPGPAFSVDQSGYRGLRIQAPQSLLSYSSILVTIEPAKGSAFPTGQEVLAGSLHNQ